MKVRSFRAGRAVDDAIDSTLAWYEQNRGDAEADRVAAIIAALIKRIFNSPEAGLLITGLPDNFQKVNAAPVAIFYTFNKSKGSVLLFMLRGNRQATIPAEELLRLAGEAGRDSIDYSSTVDPDRD